MNKSSQSIFSLLFLLLQALSLEAVDYYIAPDGNDLNDGSLESPFASIQKAMDLAEAGTTVFLREGSYTI